MNFLIFKIISQFHKQNLITQAEDQLEDEEDMIKRNRIDGIRKSPARVEEANEVEVSVLKDGSSRGLFNNCLQCCFMAGYTTLLCCLIINSKL